MFSFIISQPILAAIYMFAIVIALTIHEFAHAFVAHQYGDDTAKHLGRLTFNPLAHIDIFGALTFLVIGFGWGKPVPVNPLNFDDTRKGQLMTALAGPVSNLILAIISVISLKVLLPILPVNNLAIIFFQLSFIINIALMVFNLIPIPPLDGSQILVNALPDRFSGFKQGLFLYGQNALLLLVFLSILGVPVFSWIWGVISFGAFIFGIPLF